MIRAVIIDDEREGRNTLQNLLESLCKNVSIAGTANDVISGLDLIKKEAPDLVFLDIHMPDGTGFDLLERIEDVNFSVIFVTAYDQYALKAIKFSAIDYLLKPVEPQSLVEAVEKIKTQDSDYHLISKQISTLFRNKNGFERITLPTFEGLRFIVLKDIIRCEADNNYTNFYLSSRERVLVTRTLKEYDNALSGLEFIRVHQSHLVNSKYIDRYIKGDGGYVIMTDGSKVEVSRRRKEEFLKKMTEDCS